MIATRTPFGLDHAVTVGFVSATARTCPGVASDRSFVQTDASIDSRNPGGPVLDLDGRVVGIDTERPPTP